jgi:DNA repair protein RecN (Recombination protein N)
VLTLLRIRQLAIVEELEVAFGPGLNVVTGETGAGKSILVDALQLVLGARARPELVRSGAERAEIEAIFDLRANPTARRRLPEDLAPDGELLLRRTVEAGGRTRAYIDGRLATVAELARIGAGLCDISSQHEHHSLVDAGSHLAYLDAYAGLADEAAGLRAVWEELLSARKRVDTLLAAQKEDRADWLRFQIAEIERVLELDVDDAEIQRLRNVHELAGVVGGAEGKLHSAEGSVTARLSRVSADLSSASRLDPALAGLSERLAGLETELADVAHELGRYLRGLRADPARLAQLEDAAHELKRLRRKHGEDLRGAHRERARELDALADVGNHILDAEADVERLTLDVGRRSAALTAHRRGSAGRLAAAITDELASLGMGEARVAVEVAEAGQGPRGADHVEFLIATNRGEEPRPLRKVASGGELSRALLAVKRVLAALGPAGMYVFDEVDTGVGGAVAEAIGQKLRDVSMYHPVVCVTHLPQIAAFGRQHFHVRKQVSGERTRSSVVQLSEGERVEELARMLGGSRVGAAARAAAAELLQAARGT